MSGTDEVRESIFNVARCNDQLVEFSIDHARDPDFFLHVSHAAVCQGGAEMYSG